MITESYSTFFKELSKHNEKEWFNANKERYELCVKEPFLDLLERLLPVLREWDPRIPPDPKKALFRIHRDLRFSKDKTPYHTLLKASFAPFGKKSSHPGYYLGIDAERIHIGGGLFRPKPGEVSQIRTYIARNPEVLMEIVENERFNTFFSEVRGEQSKRLDRPFLEAAERTKLLYHKEWYAFGDLSLADYFGSDDLAAVLLDRLATMRPLVTYLDEALSQKQVTET